MKKRIDKIIADKYPELSRAEIKNLIANGGVFLRRGFDAEWAILDDPAKKIDNNAEIKIDEDKLNQIKTAREINLEPDLNIKFGIIYEDKDIAIIEKPAGIVVHPSYSHKFGTLVNGLLAKWPQISSVGDDPARPGIIHRLDKDVSGVMSVAKTQAGFQSLKKQFQDRSAKKTYIALVYGKPPAESGIIRGAIVRSKSEPTKQIISESGKEAVTEYHFVGVENFQPLQSLIQARPLTGRMHQIRVHLASIGCPIAGDKKYLPKGLLKTDNFDRVMLHAQSLEIELMNGERRKFESKILPF